MEEKESGSERPLAPTTRSISPQEVPTTAFVLSLVAGVLFLLGASMPLVFMGSFGNMRGMMEDYDGGGVMEGFDGGALPTCDLGYPDTGVLHPERVYILGGLWHRADTGCHRRRYGHCLEADRNAAAPAYRPNGAILSPLRASHTHGRRVLLVLRSPIASISCF